MLVFFLMYSPKTPTFPVALPVRQCAGAKEVKTHPGLALVSQQVLQKEAEDCCRDGEGEFLLTCLLALGFAEQQGGMVLLPCWICV